VKVQAVAGNENKCVELYGDTSGEMNVKAKKMQLNHRNYHPQ